MNSRLLLRRLNQEQLRIASASWVALLVYVFVSWGTYTYLDVYMYENDRAYGVAAFAMWGAGYLLILTLMEKAGYFNDGKESGLGTYFVLGIFLILGVLLGLVLLVVPGLYLLLRWLPAYADGLVRGGGATAALRRSWGMTEGVTLPLAIASIGPAIGFVIGMGIPLAAIINSTNLAISTIITYNLAFAVSSAWFTVLGIASFGMLADGVSEIDSEFEIAGA